MRAFTKRPGVPPPGSTSCVILGALTAQRGQTPKAGLTSQTVRATAKTGRLPGLLLWGRPLPLLFPGGLSDSPDPEGSGVDSQGPRRHLEAGGGGSAGLRGRAFAVRLGARTVLEPWHRPGPAEQAAPAWAEWWTCVSGGALAGVSGQ